MPPDMTGENPVEPTLYPEELGELEKLFESLPTNYGPEQHETILRAYVVASHAHREQMRRTGEPYILHPIAVAQILSELRLDADAISAALLHDLVEDTPFTLEYVNQQFGPVIGEMVDGVTKLKRINELSNIRQNAADEKVESLRKMFLAMVEDIRVVLIKLADRVHNMRTLQGQPDHKRRRIARETLEIFAPLANRLGIWQIKWELEDLSFRYLEPATYKEISRAMADKRVQREEWVAGVCNILNEELSQAGIPAEVSGRPKHIYSIYRKMKRKDVPFEEIYDIHGFRIVVDTETNCYAALGIVHGKWRPIPGEFDDYIASPKDNLYRSLHTAVVGPEGKHMEVQIRTQEMHYTAEMGIAAHWRYKEQSKPNDYLDGKIAWIRQIMDWRQDVTDAHEFVTGMKSDVFQDRVYVFTPQGDVIDLPTGATPIDFAYRVHTELGHRCRSARVNGKQVSLDYKLMNGEQVEIHSAKRGGPSRDWMNTNLGYVVTQRARSKVRSWFRKQAREENIIEGRHILEKDLKRLSVQMPFEAVAKLNGYDKLDDFLAAIGYGDISSQQIAQRILDNERQQRSADEDVSVSKPFEENTDWGYGQTSVSVDGMEGLLVRYAGCCQPTPGDPIIGYITRGRGVTIHKSNCSNILSQLEIGDQSRLVEVNWRDEADETWPVSIQVLAYDRPGLLRDVTSLVADEKINMRSAEALTGMKNNTAIIKATLEISNAAQLTRILSRLERLPNVLEVHRRVG
jgi:GTP pyrophosphokinase